MTAGEVIQWGRRGVAALRARPRRTWLMALGALCVLISLYGWALASPVGASPDDDYHLTSIWCSHGLRPGLCEAGPTPTSRLVPSEIPHLICAGVVRNSPFTIPLLAPQCGPDSPEHPTMRLYERGNFATNGYPPVFYWFDGLFASSHVERSVIVMRLVNSTLYVAFLVAVYLLLPPRLRRTLVAAAMLTAIPVGAFVIASVNPSGWAMLSAATLLVCLIGYLTASGRRQTVGLGVASALAVLVGAGARADAASYAVLAVVVALLLTQRRGAIAWRRLILPAVLVVAAAVAFFSVGQTNAADPGGTSQPPLSLHRLVVIVQDAPGLWAGGFGGWPGLGWIDTPLTALVWTASGGAFASVVFLALAHRPRRQAVAAGLVAVAALVLPIYVEFVSAIGTQPRYVLPLLTLLVATVVVRPTGEVFALTRGQRWLVVAALAVANASALRTNLLRYLVGGETLRSAHGLAWWWPIPVSPAVVAVVTVVATAVGFALLSRDLAVPRALEPAPLGGAGGDGALPVGSGSNPGRHQAAGSA